MMNKTRNIMTQNSNIDIQYFQPMIHTQSILMAIMVIAIVSSLLSSIMSMNRYILLMTRAMSIKLTFTITQSHLHMRYHTQIFMMFITKLMMILSMVMVMHTILSINNHSTLKFTMKRITMTMVISSGITIAQYIRLTVQFMMNIQLTSLLTMLLSTTQWIITQTIMETPTLLWQ